jgi:hypothetical protein
MAGLDRGRLQVRRVAGVAPTLCLAGAGTGLMAIATLAAALAVRQAARAAPVHPYGAAAGLLAFPLGALCWWTVRRCVAGRAVERFRAWSLREL